MKPSLPAINLTLKAAASAIVIAAAFFTTSCSKKTSIDTASPSDPSAKAAAVSQPAKSPEPEPFTAQLDEVQGAMIFYSLQHPKLISQGLNKLIAEIPEASYARVLLETYGAQYGYPEFSELAADASIGIYQPAQSLEQLKRGGQSPVIFMKVKEGGKIWNALVNQFGMRAQKRGEWTLFARSPSDDIFEAVANPDAVIARLSAPQAENVRMWAGLNGAMRDTYQSLISEIITKAIDKSAIPDTEKTAFNAYAGIILPELFASTHSARASLHFADTGLRINYGAQFKPDSPLGTFARYRSDATPVVGQYIANDSLLSASVRYVPKAAQDVFDYLTGLFLKVDYPPFSTPLAQFKKDYADYWKQMDGCGAMTIDMEMDLENLEAPKSKADTFVAYSGKFDRRSMSYMKASIDLAEKFINQISAIAAQSSDKKIPRITLSSESNAATIDGNTFDAMTLGVTGGEIEIPPQKTYYGAAGGNLITASSEATIQKRLPALLAQKTLPGNVTEANPLAPYDIMSMTLNGGALVDFVCKTSRIDLSDPDRQAAFASIKDTYKQTTPACVTIETRQAAITYKADIPYKFISASVKLGQYTYAAKRQDAK